MPTKKKNGSAKKETTSEKPTPVTLTPTEEKEKKETKKSKVDNVTIFVNDGADESTPVDGEPEKTNSVN